MYTNAVVVIGASRGIGLELAIQLHKQHPAQQDAVVATMRTPRNDILPNGVAVESLDVTDDSSVDAFAAKLDSIDTLIINAAVGDAESLMETDGARMGWYMETNVVGVHRIVRALVPALRKGEAEKRKLIYISSTSASMQRQASLTRGLQGAYSVSKAAGQMLIIQYYNELRDDRVAVGLIHPGWVATDLGKTAGDGGMPVEESVSGILNVINGDQITFDKGPIFLDWKGETVPW